MSDQNNAYLVYAAFQIILPEHTDRSSMKPWNTNTIGKPNDTFDYDSKQVHTSKNKITCVVADCLAR